MNPRLSEKEWLAEFQEFAGAEKAVVPDALARTLQERIAADLNPPAWAVFGKLAGLQAVVGVLSLLLCNQFGMNPFGTEFSLSDYFMRFGHSTCMLLCGVLFASLSVAAAGWLLRPEEQKVFGRHPLLQLFALSTLSLGAFAAFGAEIALAIGALWLAGYFAGALVASRLCWRRPPLLVSPLV